MIKEFRKRVHGRGVSIINHFLRHENLLKFNVDENVEERRATVKSGTEYVTRTEKCLLVKR